LTIIFQLGYEYWIESFTIARSSIASGAGSNTDVTLERAGFFLGCTESIDANLAASVAPDLAVTIKNTSNAELNFGQEISGVRITRQNNDAGAALFGAHVLIFMRGPGLHS